MGRLSRHQDPIAVVLSSVVGILGALGLIERAGLTGDQVAEILGFAVAIVASIRTVVERRKHREVEDLRATVQTHRRQNGGTPLADLDRPPQVEVRVRKPVEDDTTDRIDPEDA